MTKYISRNNGSNPTNLGKRKIQFMCNLMHKKLTMNDIQPASILKAALSKESVFWTVQTADAHFGNIGLYSSS